MTRSWAVFYRAACGRIDRQGAEEPISDSALFRGGMTFSAACIRLPKATPLPMLSMFFPVVISAAKPPFGPMISVDAEQPGASAETRAVRGLSVRRRRPPRTGWVLVGYTP